MPFNTDADAKAFCAEYISPDFCYVEAEDRSGGTANFAAGECVMQRWRSTRLQGKLPNHHTHTVPEEAVAACCADATCLSLDYKTAGTVPACNLLAVHAAARLFCVCYGPDQQLPPEIRV